MKTISTLIFFLSFNIFAQVIPVVEIISPPEPAQVENFFKVAVVQWNPKEDAPVGSTQEKISEYIRANRDEMALRVLKAVSQKAQFVTLSEFAVVGYPDIPELPSEEDDFRNRKDIEAFVDTVPGVSTAFFSNLAKQNNVWIQFGLAEVDPISDKYYNTVVVVNNLGEMVASFRKNSLYQLENQFLSPGLEAVVFDSPMGKVGLAICADIYNQSLMNTYKNLGVQVIALSTSWAHMNTGMNTFISAAKNNSAYILAANQTYFPDSGVINPDGSIQSHIRQAGDEIAYGYIPLAEKIVSKRDVIKAD